MFQGGRDEPYQQLTIQYFHILYTMPKKNPLRKEKAANVRYSLNIETEVPRQVADAEAKFSNKCKFRKHRWNVKHECALDDPFDEVELFYPGRHPVTKIKKWIVKRTVASPNNPLTKLILQSEAAIRAERYHHLRTSIWEVAMVFVLFLSIIEIPMHSTFKLGEYKCFWIADYTMASLCLLDIAFSFASGYYDTHTHVVYLKPLIVARHYLLTFFLPDFLGAFPFDVVIKQFSTNETVAFYLHVLPVIKLFRIVTLLRYFKQFALEIDLAEQFVITLRFVILTTIYLQWVSCGFYFVAEFTQWKIRRKADKHSWIMKRNLYNASNWRKYLFSLFRGFTSAFNLGIGAAKPETSEDIYFACFVVLTGQGFLVLLLSLMYQLKSASTASRRKYVSMVQQLKEFMAQDRLPDKLQRRCLQYYAFRFRKRYFREQEILATLTGQLSEEVILFSCRQLVENVDFFRDLPMDLIVRIVSHLRSEIYLPNDVIVEADTKGDYMYFIASGSVAVYASDNLELTHLEEGGHFGEIALVMEEKRVATVVAVETCELYRLDRVDFHQALKPYPEILLMIERIARKRLEDTREHKRMSSKAENFPELQPSVGNINRTTSPAGSSSYRG